MKASSIPAKFAIPFANNAATGTIRPVPQASQAASNPGAASLYDGFPIATGTAIAAGGIPPAMQDFNGILNQVSAWSQWQAAAGLVPYDNSFANSIGGYPQGATVLSTTTLGRVWISTADNNSTNPDSGSSANWLALMLPSDVVSTVASRNIVGSNVAFFSTAGASTWPVPAGITRIRARVWGAGGGGGSASGSGSGAGGNGGGYSEGVFTVAPGASLTVTVGAGGLGYSGTVGGAGGTGGTSSVGSLISATGGSGGGGSNSSGAINGLYGVAGAAAGGGSGGSINVSGGGAANAYSTNPPMGSAGAGAFCTSGSSPSVSGGIVAVFPAGGGGGGAQGFGGVVGAGGLVIIEY